MIYTTYRMLLISATQNIDGIVELEWQKNVGAVKKLIRFFTASLRYIKSRQLIFSFFGLSTVSVAVGSRKNHFCTAGRDFGRQYVFHIWKYLLSKPHEVAVQIWWFSSGAALRFWVQGGVWRSSAWTCYYSGYYRWKAAIRLDSKGFIGAHWYCAGGYQQTGKRNDQSLNRYFESKAIYVHVVDTTCDTKYNIGVTYVYMG